MANWLKSGGKKRDRPEQIPRPGVEKAKAYGAEPVSMEEMNERLAKRRHLALVEPAQDRQV